MKHGVMGGFEDAIEKGQSTIKNAVKQSARDFATSARGQITGAKSSSTSDQGTNEQANVGSSQMSNDQAKQFLKDLYGPTNKNDQNNNVSPGHPVSEALGLPVRDPNAGKSPEDVARLQAARNRLHQDYYQKLTNPQKPTEKPVTERLEEEKKMEDLESSSKQEKLPGPLQHAKKGTVEINIGPAG